MFLLPVAFLVGGVAIVSVGAKARVGWFSRESLAGIRTKATLASDDTWQAAHKAGAGWVMAGGVFLALGGLLAVVTDAADATILLLTLVAALFTFAVGWIKGHAAALRTWNDPANTG